MAAGCWWIGCHRVARLPMSPRKWGCHGSARTAGSPATPPSPKRTSPAVEAAVVAARRKYRRGPDWLAAELGVPARTVSRILRRHQLPYLADCDPLTG